ncbi:HdeD family acid-resistance protein [Subtercola sp. YIM 133946]|uniref:HdeD family acid-resistance protein n=1 Tax=Subtercola sp. YIM 133946 TaxID=3118909 RepID=UPI002F9233E0
MSSNTTPTYSYEAADVTASTVRWFKIALWVGAVLSVIIGIVILAWPGSTLEVVAFFFGLYFFVIGLVRVFVGIIDRDLSTGWRVLSVVLGVLLLIAGVFALKNPGATLVLLALLIGISWITEGIIALTQVSGAKTKWFPIVFGILAIIAGIVMIFVPIWSLAILTVFAAWTLIVLGIVQAVTAITLRTPKNV